MGALEGWFDGDQGPAHRSPVGVPGPALRLGCHHASGEGLTASNCCRHYEWIVPGHLSLKVLGAVLQDFQPCCGLERRGDVAEEGSALGDPVAVVGPFALVCLPSDGYVLGGWQETKTIQCSPTVCPGWRELVADLALELASHSDWETASAAVCHSWISSASELASQWGWEFSAGRRRRLALPGGLRAVHPGRWVDPAQQGGQVEIL